MSNLVIIGAGAAGLAAGHALQAAGQTVTILEARNRIGGRVWTDRSFVDFPIENGAEFIHGDQAITWQWVRAIQAQTIPIGKYSSYAYEYEGRLYSYEEMLRWPDFARVFGLEEQEIGQLDLTKPDQSVQHWLARLGITPQAQQTAAQFLAHPYLAEPEDIGVADLAHEVQVHHSGYGNFRLRDGYDQIMTALAQGLDLQLNTAVQTVRWDTNPLRIGAEVAGQPVQFSADRVVITVPLALLQQQAIRFEPALPATKVQAIQALRMGPVVKLQLEFSESFWPSDVSLFSGLGPVPVWWSPGYCRGSVRAVLTAFVGGKRALALNRQAETEAVACAVTDLCRLFSSDAPRRLLLRGRRISWIDDPWSRGGYSYVPTGAYGARQILAQPVQDVLFFAGEATVTDSNPATVHGAIETGIRAAQQILKLNHGSEPALP
ncbi:NAD(P)/FAD-dependent oxidoreductase [Leptolyngbya sp. FACHB-261]|uniref:flavin monoamine oxidase family protein n=1 Tax=Leptolyngbya sp. FACHB-261 TaxID=2692806 RepID=UPI0016899DDF|nr:NAD(P)/FAD-dependent oxidoreductase [Leptolyngbya sp. FACHB-261]MBD2102226.1 FAD-dependent oxidoreductase [Leptolyngbya sp. FACHB-261]